MRGYQFACLQVVENGNGKLTRVASWESMGSAFNGPDAQDVKPDDLYPHEVQSSRPRKLCRTGTKLILYEEFADAQSPASQDTSFAQAG